MTLADARSNSEWMPEYKAELNTKILNRCQTCGNRARKGCCPFYSAENRSKTMMIIGWSEARRAEVPVAGSKAIPARCKSTMIAEEAHVPGNMSGNYYTSLGYEIVNRITQKSMPTCSQYRTPVTSSDINAAAGCDLKWDIIKFLDDDEFFIIPHTRICAVNDNYVHDEEGTSYFSLNKEHIEAKCVRHGRRILTGNVADRMLQLFFTDKQPTLRLKSRALILNKLK